LVKSLIYIEGGDGSKLGRRRCRQAFSKLLEGCGLKNRMPDLRACGRRDSAFDDFKTAFTASAQGDYIAMLVDSEDPVRDPERTWEHLRKRDPSWVKPDGASDEHVFFMTTAYSATG
jgi:hypothetical protein